MSKVKTRMRENVEMLTRERDRLLAEVEALKNKISGLELAISLMSREDGHEAAADAPKRGNSKVVLLDLLRDVGTTGLNATSAVEIAHRRGIKLERGTAASNLSRLKADGVVTYDGERYRLPEFTRQPTLAVVAGKNS